MTIRGARQGSPANLFYDRLFRIDPSTRDLFADLSRYETDQVEGPLRDQLIDAVGEEIYAHWVQVRRALADAVAVGALRPTHLRGFKPES